MSEIKKVVDWWFPTHEQHFIEWMQAPKNKVVLNGRLSYQGRKQLATLKHCRGFHTAVDIGGHVGTWSWNLAHAFRQVHAFEPVTLHRECFVKNTEGKTNITLHCEALGDREGSVNIWTEQGSSGNSFVKGSGDIPMRTLDSFYLDDVDLIKVDCEGFEEKVLRGAENTIRRCKPTIIVEQKRDMACKFGLDRLGAVMYLQGLGLGYAVAMEYSGDYIMVPA